MVLSHLTVPLLISPSRGRLAAALASPGDRGAQSIDYDRAAKEAGAVFDV